jgi:hypothetical protein
MQGSMRDDETTVVVHGDGYITAEGALAARRLASRAGRWRLVASPPTMLMLHREYEPGGDPGRVALTGDVTACGGLLDIINLIKASAWSGALSVTCRNTRRTIYFRNGEVRTASSNLPEDRLGQILYRFGIITRQQMDQALTKVGPGSKMGKVLVQMAAITATDLYRWVTRQVEEIFYALLLVRDGEFYFERDGKEPPGANLALPTQSLLLEGCRRMDELSYFRAKLKSSGVVLSRREDAKVPSDLSKVQHGMLELVDGSRTLEELARVSHLGEFEATHAAFGLLQAGLVEVLEGPPKREAAAATRGDLEKVVDAVNWLLRAAYEAIAARGEGDRYRDDLRTYLGSLGVYGPLFDSIRTEADGALPPRAVVERVLATHGDEPLVALLQALDEVVRFALFSADLAPDAEQQMRTRIADVVSQTGKAAPPAML